MARGTATRSQRAPNPSQTQRVQRRQGNQRVARSAADDDDDDSEQGQDAGGGAEGHDDDDAEVAGTQRRRGGAGDEVARRANDLVRLALFTEQKRVPLKRDEISKKVLGANKRSFNEVLANAQDILKKTFGMELVELKSRAAEEEDGEKRKNANDEELEEARNATGIKKRAVTGSKTYILRSVLDPIIIEHAALTDEAILAEEATEFHADDDEDEEPGVRSYGSIIAWSSGDQLAPLGILHVILALILVSGRVMSDADLRSTLRRLQLLPTATIPLTSQSTLKALTVDAHLTTLIRQGYIERRPVGDPKAKKGAGGSKRVRATQGGGDDDGITWEWRWGHRAHSEIGEKGVAQFVAEFMVESERRGMEVLEEEDGEGRAGNRRRQNKETEARKRLEAVMKGIGRAAGGDLTDGK